MAPCRLQLPMCNSRMRPQKNQSQEVWRTFSWDPPQGYSVPIPESLSKVADDPDMEIRVDKTLHESGHGLHKPYFNRHKALESVPGHGRTSDVPFSPLGNVLTAVPQTARTPKSHESKSLGSVPLDCVGQSSTPRPARSSVGVGPFQHHQMDEVSQQDRFLHVREKPIEEQLAVPAGLLARNSTSSNAGRKSRVTIPTVPMAVSTLAGNKQSQSARPASTKSSTSQGSEPGNLRRMRELMAKPREEAQLPPVGELDWNLCTVHHIKDKKYYVDTELTGGRILKPSYVAMNVPVFKKEGK
eukprot:TRINITY_DN34915_c0_g1_i1.p1 TRINITY_DN34915_c0_g1~~TRINITY_DN34915_c0_g1_i1.p1  ORF type:complete len:314 (-),score=24.03 TRINITY_DN34915_c0_g1_i1:43-939(-)